MYRVVERTLGQKPIVICHTESAKRARRIWHYWKDECADRCLVERHVADWIKTRRQLWKEVN